MGAVMTHRADQRQPRRRDGRHAGRARQPQRPRLRRRASTPSRRRPSASSSSASRSSRRARSCASRASTAPWRVCIGCRLAGARTFTASLVQRPGLHGRERLRRGLLPPADRDDGGQPHARAALEHLGRPRRHPDAARRGLDPALLRGQPGGARLDPARLPPRRGPRGSCCPVHGVPGRLRPLAHHDADRRAGAGAGRPLPAGARPAPPRRRPGRSPSAASTSRTRPRSTGGSTPRRMEPRARGLRRGPGRVRGRSSGAGRPTRSCPTGWTTPRSCSSRWARRPAPSRAAVDAARASGASRSARCASACSAPSPRRSCAGAWRGCKRVGVLDRDISLGLGGVLWSESARLGGRRDAGAELHGRARAAATSVPSTSRT